MQLSIIKIIKYWHKSAVLHAFILTDFRQNFYFFKVIYKKFNLIINNKPLL